MTLINTSCVSQDDLYFRYFQFNTTIPVRTLLLTWGPYVAMCMYACVENAKLVSPKLRMVRKVPHR